MTRVILVRHGETEWNRVERFRGRIDVELNETGHDQAQAVAERLRGRTIDAVYSSPLKRALHTAQPIAEVSGHKVQRLQGMIDVDYGDWAGRSPQEVADEYPDVYQTWVQASHLVEFPGGESLEQVKDRAWAALEEVCLRYPDHTAVVVSHVVVNRVLVCAALGLVNSCFWKIAQDNAAISVLECQQGEYRLLLLNDTCHLEGLSAAQV